MCPSSRLTGFGLLTQAILGAGVSHCAIGHLPEETWHEKFMKQFSPGFRNVGNVDIPIIHDNS